MDSFLESIWYRLGDILGDIPGDTWQWFDGLSREEWLVTLAIVCGCGFLSLRGLQSPRP